MVYDNQLNRKQIVDNIIERMYYRYLFDNNLGPYEIEIADYMSLEHHVRIDYIRTLIRDLLRETQKTYKNMYVITKNAYIDIQDVVNKLEDICDETTLMTTYELGDILLGEAPEFFI